MWRLPMHKISPLTNEYAFLFFFSLQKQKYKINQLEIYKCKINQLYEWASKQRSSVNQGGKQFSNPKLQTTPINHVSKVYKVKEPFISLFRSQKVCSLNN